MSPGSVVHVRARTAPFAWGANLGSEFGSKPPPLTPPDGAREQLGLRAPSPVC
jgi:hypothetical protein